MKAEPAPSPAVSVVGEAGVSEAGLAGVGPGEAPAHFQQVSNWSSMLSLHFVQVHMVFDLCNEIGGKYFGTTANLAAPVRDDILCKRRLLGAVDWLTGFDF